MQFNMEFFENSYRLLDASLAEQSSSSSDWLSGFRDSAFKKAKKLGVPDRKVESWKYTNLSSLTKEMQFPVDLNHNLGLKDLPESVRGIVGDAEVGLVFFNGEWSKDLSWGTEQQGLIVEPLGDFFQGKPESVKGLSSEEIQGWITGFEDHVISRDDSEVFSLLNSALAFDGYVIRVSPKTVIETPIQIVNLYGDRGASDRSFRNVVIVGDGAEVAVSESHWGLSGVECISNTVTDLYLGIHSHLNYLRAYIDSGSNLNVGTVRARLLKDSQLSLFSLNSGGSITRNEAHIQVNGRGASVQANGLALLGESQHLDSRTTIQHNEPNTQSRQLYKSVLNDSARNVFNGKIYIASQAQNVDSDQLNQNLVLGENAEADTKPELEVYADDVRATHGATVGQMNEEELFYLISRAISKEEATAMLARAFVEDVVLKVNHKSLREQIDKMVDLNFDQFLDALKERITEGGVNAL